METLKFIGGLAVMVIVTTCLGVGIAIVSFQIYAYFAPKYEGVRRDVMIESRSYSEGTIRELYTLQRQYQTAKGDEKTTIAAAARHEFSIFPKDRLPADLRDFLNEVGG